MSSEKRDSPWFRSEVLNQRKKNSCNSTELTSKHLSALHLIQHNSEHSTDASTDTGAAEGPVQRFMGFFALFARHVQVFHNALVKMDMLNKKTKKERFNSLLTSQEGNASHYGATNIWNKLCQCYTMYCI